VCTVCGLVRRRCFCKRGDRDRWRNPCDVRLESGGGSRSGVRRLCITQRRFGRPSQYRDRYQQSDDSRQLRRYHSGQRRRLRRVRQFRAAIRSLRRSSLRRGARADPPSGCDAFPSANTEADAFPDPNTGCDAFPDANTGRDAIPNANAEADAFPNANTGRDAFPNANTGRDAIPDANTEADAFPNANTDSDANPYANTGRDAFPDANTEADAFPNTDCDANPYAIYRKPSRIRL
jgi:hypothetical protein